MDIDSIALNPTYDLPLAFGELQLADILKAKDSSHFRSDDDGLMYVAYDDELLSEDVRDLFNIPDLPVNRSFVMPGMVVPALPEDFRSDSIQSVISFSLDPEKLNEIGLNAGQISYSVTLTPQSNLDYEVYLVLDGFRSRTSNKTLNTVIEDEGVIDISDYTLTLDENKFDLKLVLVFKRSNSPVTIAPATSVNVELVFENFEFDYIKGFLGDQTTSIEPRTVALGIFQNGIFDDGDVSFAQPRVNLTVLNENGVPCTVHFVKLEARKEGADPISIVLDPANPVALEFPTVMGETETTVANVVNVKDLMDYAPSEIFYQADVRINEGFTSGNNFMIDSSAMRVRMNIEVPLWGSATGIVLQDTLNVNLEKVEGSEVVEASLKMNLVNEFPLGGDVQFILTDENYVPLTTLLLPDQTNIIQPSTVDTDGELQAAGQYDGLIELDASKIEDLFKAKHLILMANLQTSRSTSGSAPNVKFLDHYGLAIKTGIVATLKLTTE